MKAKGIDLSFNYNITSLHQPNNTVNFPLFSWSNGILELPLAVLEHRGRMLQFDFNEHFNYGFHARRFNLSRSTYRFMDQYFQRFPNSVMSMIMHSWSFTDVDPCSGFRTFRDLKLVNDFDTFLANLPREYEVITATEMRRRYLSGEVTTDIIRDVDLMDRGKYCARSL